MLRRKFSSYHGFLLVGFIFAALGPFLVYYGEKMNVPQCVSTGFIITALSAYLIYHGMEVSAKTRSADFQQYIKEKVDAAIAATPPGPNQEGMKSFRSELESDFSQFEKEEDTLRRAILQKKLTREQENLASSAQWRDYFSLARKTLIDYLTLIQEKRPTLAVTFELPPLPSNFVKDEWKGRIHFGQAKSWNVEFLAYPTYAKIWFQDSTPSKRETLQYSDERERWNAEYSKGREIARRILDKLELEMSGTNSLELRVKCDEGFMTIPDIKDRYPSKEVMSAIPMIIKKAIEVQLVTL